MAATISALLSNMQNYQNNPALIQQDILDHLDIVTSGGVNIVDPSNPFVFGLESATVCTAGMMSKSDTNTRRQYPQLAQTPEDLYYHMSDWDYINRFAAPSVALFSFIFDKDELISKLVTDPTTGVSQIVIPRNTVVMISGVQFSLQYPIVIRQMQHGGLNVTYDGSQPSPLQELTSNVIDWEIRTVNGTNWLFFDVPLYQFNILSTQQGVSLATKWQTTISFSDQFYYARVWAENSDGTWSELVTTHSIEVYDPTTPTAVLQVVNQTLTVTIPQIYITSGQVKTSVRVDLYQTKGDINMDLSSYPQSAYSANWLAIDANDNLPTNFSAPLKGFNQLAIWSNDRTVDGNNGLTFSQLRQRVMTNSTGAQNLPITNVQVQAALQNIGYDVVENVDNITNRVFLATRAMPDPTNPALITSAAASIETLSTTLTALTTLESVINNGNSLTITPDTIYQSTSGVVSAVPTAAVKALLALPPDQRALAVTKGQYFYSPWHYVLDNTGPEFEVRPYYLDAPVADTTFFVSENDTTLLQVSTKSYQITKNTDGSGYTLTISTSSNDGWKALADDKVYVQLAYIPEGESGYAYLMGTLVGTNTSTNERTFSFDLSSNFNVDSNDMLQLKKFLMYTTDPMLTACSLTQTFDILYAADAVMDTQWKPGEIDAMLGMFLLPATVVGVTHEQVRVKFGSSLTTLWASTRTVNDAVTYRTWPMDVLSYYTNDVYGDPAVTIVNGQVVQNIVHHAGDPVINPATGQQVLLHAAGDVMKDVDGKPIPIGTQDTLRQIDLMLLEGVYWFATDAIATGYRTELVDTVLAWLTEDLVSFQAKLLEQTRIYFYPKATTGNINVMINGGLKTTVAAGQSFKVTLYVPASVYSNSDLQNQLVKTTISTISAQLENATVADSALKVALMKIYGEDVIDCEVSGLGGSASISVMTVIDASNKLSIRKRLFAQSDNSLIVQEDVSVSFIQHQLS
jgi:hypothetical protein